MANLKNIFEKPLPDPITSWTQLLPKAETSDTVFDMFGDLCHRVSPESSPCSPPPPPPPAPRPQCATSDTDDDNALEIFGELCYKTKPSPMAPDSPLEDDNVDRSMGDVDHEDGCGKKVMTASYSDVRSKCNNSLFPPPITSIGTYGKPRVYFKSYRQDGRFVLREIRIPTQRLLRSRREDGRLRMQVVSPVKDVVVVARRGDVEDFDHDEEEDINEDVAERE